MKSSTTPTILMIIMAAVWIKMIRSVPSSLAFSSAPGSVRTTSRISRPLTLASSSTTPTARRASSSSSSSSSSYSTATQQRIRGLDAATEFSKLAIRLDKSPDELKLALAQQRLQSSSSSSVVVRTEKEEYLDWMLSGVMETVDANVANQASKNNKSSQNSAVAAAPTTRTSDTTTTNGSTGTQQQTFQTDLRFDDESQIELHWNSRKAVAAMGLKHMTEIQAKTFAVAATGHDVLGRARTGTGKTVAFLLPAIERLIRQGTLDDPHRIGMLVVSPTRELATQIGEQAKQLLRHHPGTWVQVMFGGTNVKSDVTQLSSPRTGLPTILVATPGRLLDHLQTTRLEMGGNLVSFGTHIMSETNLVVLDETDRLLDMGFRRDIDKILNYLPSSQTRQTLLFSATMPPELKTIMRQNMKSDYVEVDCVKDGDAATHTNDRVAQTHIVLPNEIDMVSSVVETVRYAVETHVNHEPDGSSRFVTPPKIVVFFPTARLVQFYAEIFENISQGVRLTEHSGVDNKEIKLKSWELHSKKSQGYRNRVSNEFREATTGVLFTSDVSARGVDYPNVSHVIQFGMPENREQYIHRLGRTGRAGSKGKGWLVLQDWEAAFLKELKGVDIPQNDDLMARFLESDISQDSQSVVREVRRRVRGGDGVLSKSASAAYAAFLGYYKSQMKRMGMRSAENLVGIANDFAMSSGFPEPPQLQKSTVSKMGLKGVAGLNIGGDAYSAGARGGGRGGGGRGPSRGGGSGGRGGGNRSESRRSNDNGRSNNNSNNGGDGDFRRYR